MNPYPNEPELDWLLNEFVMDFDVPVKGLEDGNILGEGQHAYLVTWMSDDKTRIHVYHMDETDLFIFRKYKDKETRYVGDATIIHP